jgi:hypothetical protein
MPTTQNLMTIATNSNLRIHERIKLIKESDGIKGISSPEEARAIIAIPTKDLIFTDNKEGLSVEKMYAYSYLKDGGKNLWDDLEMAYNYCKEKGSNLLSRLSRFFEPETNSIAKK